MANRNGFQIEIEIGGLDDFINELERGPETFERNVEANMQDYGMLLEEGASALAPYDGGDLETSIQFNRFVKSARSMVGEVGSDLKYAMKQHEMPVRRGEHPKYDNGIRIDSYYTDGRGQETILKGRWRGLEPGRKYLERAMVATEGDFEDLMDDAYEKTLRELGR